MSERQKGTVKWFNNDKGYGFIERSGGKDLFVPFRSIVGEGHRSLVDGQEVENKGEAPDMTEEQEYAVEDTSGAKLQASEEGVRRYVEAGIGLSVHWGLYALSTEATEWIYYQNRIP